MFLPSVNNLTCSNHGYVNAVFAVAVLWVYVRY